MNKHKCHKCDSMAIWFYAPHKKENYYCDVHVPRGCSCNINPDTLEEDLDEQGRLYPCCEYWWDDQGFEDN